MIAMVQEWMFRRGFKAGYQAAKSKKFDVVAQESSYGKGYRLGIAAYALSLEPEAALEASVRGVFYSSGDGR